MHGKPISVLRQTAKVAWEFINSHDNLLILSERRYRDMMRSVANMVKAKGFTRQQVLEEIGRMLMDGRTRRKGKNVAPGMRLK